MVSSLPITGCDIYPLVLFDRSMLKQEFDENKELQIPGIDAEYQDFSTVQKYMSREWHKYSPVHFGKPDTEKVVYVKARSINFNVGKS